MSDERHGDPNFCKKLTCPKAEHVVRSVDGGEAHCTLNNPSLEHQIEFDWLDGVFKRELGRLHRAGLPAAGSHQLPLTHHNRLSGPMGLIPEPSSLDQPATQGRRELLILAGEVVLAVRPADVL